MTTDPFTETANAAAREYARTPRMNVGTVQDRIGEAHADGWQAARAHLAAQEPTEDEVLAVARLFYRTQCGHDLLDGSVYKDRWMNTARAALSAARTARRDEENR